MGYMMHHAIVVTSWNKPLMVSAHETARTIFQNVSELVPSAVNVYWTFLVPPDGSKEYWDDSNRGDEARERFIEWMDAQRYADGSSALHWVEVRYGEVPSDAKLTAHDGQAKRKRKNKGAK